MVSASMPGIVAFPTVVHNLVAEYGDQFATNRRRCIIRVPWFPPLERAAPGVLQFRQYRARLAWRWVAAQFAHTATAARRHPPEATLAFSNRFFPASTLTRASVGLATTISGYQLIRVHARRPHLP